MDNTEKIKACTLLDDNNIHGFFGEHRFLSNFHLMPSQQLIYHDNGVYQSTEAAYMASKTLDPKMRVQFENIEPKEAKKLGRVISLRPDWEEVKDQIMYEVNLIKYSVSEDLKSRLLATGDKHLEETNWWKDTYWGVCDGVGRNQLGITLMRIRDELRHPVQKLYKPKYLKMGYTENWGDGAANNDELCILKKTAIYPSYPHGVDEYWRTDYIVLSKNHNPVIFYGVQYYGC